MAKILEFFSKDRPTVPPPISTATFSNSAASNTLADSISTTCPVRVWWLAQLWLKQLLDYWFWLHRFRGEVAQLAKLQIVSQDLDDLGFQIRLSNYNRLPISNCGESRWFEIPDSSKQPRLGSPSPTVEDILSLRHLMSPIATFTSRRPNEAQNILAAMVASRRSSFGSVLWVNTIIVSFAVSSHKGHLRPGAVSSYIPINFIFVE